MVNSGLSRHIGKIWKMMNRANCEDGLSQFCTKSYSLEDLSREAIEEMEGDRLPNIANYYREYGKAIAIVRTVYQGQQKSIAGLKIEDIEDIESGELHPSVRALNLYADALGLSLDEFLEKVANNVDFLKAMEAIA